MTDAEIATRRIQRAAAEKAPLYQRLLEWPVCLCIYLVLGAVAPVVYATRFLMGRP
jgi:hypothetical protein